MFCFHSRALTIVTARNTPVSRQHNGNGRINFLVQLHLKLQRLTY